MNNPMTNMIASSPNRKTRIWATIITSIGVLCSAYFGWVTVDGIVRLQTDPDIYYSPMVESFTMLFGFVTLVSLRLVARRAWAGLILALLGWYVLLVLLPFPSGANQMHFVYIVLGGGVLLLTAAILMGEDAWKGGF